MEAIRSAGIDELEALCGGACSCATCHVYLENSILNLFSKPTNFEDELLSCSDHRTPASRLSCQLTIASGLPAFNVSIAPEN